MKAVFVHRDCVLRDSHVDADPTDGWRLMPATLEAMRLLSSTEGTLVFLLGQSRAGAAHPESEERHILDTILKQVEAAGGRIDGTILCNHEPDAECRCWNEHPGILWVAALQFSLNLDACYLLADSARDVVTACHAGARPVLVLGSRTVGEVLGNLPDRKDFPIATDLTTAVSYIAIEDEISRQLGHARGDVPPLPSPDELFSNPQALPTVTITSSVAQALQTRVSKARLQLRDVGRWLTFFVLGALGISLGIAYMLTHLYRVQPFPEFVYWVTLQFIPRLTRGILFTALGAAALFLTIRGFYRSTNVTSWRRKPR
ncbi:MAG: HAD hydrolase-like protein [Anaerolineae bacterium]